MGKTLFMLDPVGNSTPAGTGSYLKARSAILRSSNWTNQRQSVSVNGVTADATSCHVIASPAPAYHDAYAEAGIRCVEQGDNTLVFAAASAPTMDIDINILIMR